MKFFGTFLLVLAVLGASAKSQHNTSYQYHDLNDYNDNKGAYRSLPVVNTHIQTSVVENPTVNFPSYIPPTTISDSCHCLKTFVRPQIRNEIITVPTVDRIVRTIITPVEETTNCGGGTRLVTVARTNNILPEAIETTGTLSKAIQSNTLGTLKKSENGFFNNGNMKEAYTTLQNTNSINRVASTTNGNNFGRIATRPIIFTFPSSVTGTFQEYSNMFSGNSDASNEQRVNNLYSNNS